MINFLFMLVFRLCLMKPCHYVFGLHSVIFHIPISNIPCSFYQMNETHRHDRPDYEEYVLTWVRKTCSLECTQGREAVA